MKIYLAHSSSFDYQNKLYLPLKQSLLWQQHEFVLPHDRNPEAVFSRDIIQSCNLFLAEVSYPSTGLGIELGWAYDLKVPIIAIHQMDLKISSSITLIAKELIGYRDLEEMIEKLTATIGTLGV